MDRHITVPMIQRQKTWQWFHHKCPKGYLRHNKMLLNSIDIARFGDTWGVATLGYSYISLEVAKNKLCSLQSSSIADQCKQGLYK